MKNPFRTRRPNRWSRLILSAVGATSLFGVVMVGTTIGLRGPPESVAVGAALPSPPGAGPAGSPRHLRVMTLNVAHGRSSGLHQALQGRDTIRGHLDAVANVIARERPAVVALQELDGPSAWSGRFDHAGHLARASGLPHHVRGEHVKGPGITYGTGLLAHDALEDARSITFAASPPTFSKGFVVSTIPWPGDATVRVSVVSVHLDYSRAAVRKRQVATMANHLRDRSGPLVVMGDFNCSWSSGDETLRWFASELDLTPLAVESDEPTYRITGRRLDWILTSRELRAVSYRVLPDALSDHQALVADLERASAPR